MVEYIILLANIWFIKWCKINDKIIEEKFYNIRDIILISFLRCFHSFNRDYNYIHWNDAIFSYFKSQYSLMR